MEMLVDDSASAWNHYITHRKLRDKVDIYISVENVKWLSLEHENIAIALEFIEIQLHSIQEYESSDTHCLRVWKHNKDVWEV